MSTGPTLTINRTTREVTLTRSPIGLQGLPGNDSLTADELAAIQGAATPSAANVFATMGDVLQATSVVVAFTPTNYTPASPDVEAHLAAIDAVLGGLL